MNASLIETVHRLVAKQHRVTAQMVLNHLVPRPQTGCLDLVVQDCIEGRQAWSRTGLDARSSRFWQEYLERVA